VNVLVVNFYSSRNRGDHMIVSAMLRLFHERGAHVRLVSDDPRDAGRYDVPVLAPLVRAWPGEAPSRARLGAAALRAQLAPAVPDDRYEWADLCVSAGGGYLYEDGSRGSRLNLLLRLAPLRAARRAGVPVVLFSQSIGPFRGRTWAALAARELRSSRLVIAREAASLEVAQRLGSRRAELCDDAAFAYWPTELPAFPVRDAVGVTVMPWVPGFTPRQYARYRDELRRGLVEALRGRHLRARVLSQVDAHEKDSDVGVVAELAGQLGAAGVDSDAVDLGDDWDGAARQLFGGLLAVVGSRLHSALAAICAGVPAVALAYRPKTGGIYARLGLEELVLPMGSFSADELAFRLRFALEEREGLSRLVGERVAVARASAERAADLTLEAAQS
jgi:colanic acid/amylovoran biosynthesis protein